MIKEREKKHIKQIEPVYGKEEKNAMMQYLDSGGWLMEHKKTQELEKMIANYIGTKHVVMLSSGTVSLATALYAYEFEEGDKIVIPTYTMLASVTALRLHGAEPVFADIERKTLCIDFEDFKRKSKKAKALMLVSINGRYPTRIEEIIEYCKDENIIIIEDACQSMGSNYNGKQIGTFGDIGCFSFATQKIVTSGGGGCLITNDKEIYERIKMIKNFGRRKGGGHDHEIIGFNFKFNDLQAVIGIEQMKKLSKRVTRKKEMYWFYEHYLRDVKGIRLINTNLKETTPWFNDILVDNRDVLISHLANEGIEARPFYPAIHMTPPYSWVKKSYKYKNDFKNSAYISKRGVWLPSSLTLTDEDIKYICDNIKEGIKNR